MAASQETQVRTSEAYVDTLDNTQAESAAVSLQDDLNYKRTLLRLIIDPAGSWFDTPPTSLAALDTLTSGLDTSLTGHLGDASVHFTEASIDHDNILNVGTNTHAQVDAHIADLGNPHGVTAVQAGAAELVHFHVAADVTDFSAAVALAPSVVLNTAKVSADGSINTHSDVVTTGPGAPVTGDVLYWDGACWTSTSPGAGGTVPIGDVSGPGSGNSTDNALARWDTTTGQLLQDSDVLLGDHVAGVATIQGAPGITLAMQSSASNPLLLKHHTGVTALEVGLTDLELKPAASLYLIPQTGSIYLQAGAGDFTEIRHADGTLALQVTPSAGGSVVVHDLLRPAGSGSQDLGSDLFPWGNVSSFRLSLPEAGLLPTTVIGTTQLFMSATNKVTALKGDGTLVDLEAGTGGGGGIAGPVSSTDSGVVLWDGVAGDTVKDSDIAISSVGSTTTVSAKAGQALAFFSDTDTQITGPGAHLDIDGDLDTIGYINSDSYVAGYTLRVGDFTAPPAAIGSYAQIMVDPADGILKVRKSTGDGGTLVSLEGGGGGSGLQLAAQQFAPAALQVNFTLGQAPAGRTIMFVNGFELFENDAFTVSGNTVTFLPGVAGYTLGPPDLVSIYYEV